MRPGGHAAARGGGARSTGDISGGLPSGEPGRAPREAEGRRAEKSRSPRRSLGFPFSCTPLRVGGQGTSDVACCLWRPFLPPPHLPLYFTPGLSNCASLDQPRWEEGREPPALQTPRAPLKHPLRSHPPPNQFAGELGQAALCTKRDRRWATGRDGPMRSKGSLA